MQFMQAVRPWSLLSDGQLVVQLCRQQTELETASGAGVDHLRFQHSMSVSTRIPTTNFPLSISP